MQQLLVPRLAVPSLPSAGFPDVPSMFHGALNLSLEQRWLLRREAHFTPGEVSVGWGRAPQGTGDALWVWARLTDEEPENAARRPNEHTWRLGDVFEIFAGARQDSVYFELHITPENQTLQLRIEDFAAMQRNFEGALMADGPLWHRTRLVPGGWEALAAVPLALISSESRGFLSFGRYDYQPERELPVISSTSPHAMPNFHRRFEWLPFQLAS